MAISLGIGALALATYGVSEQVSAAEEQKEATGELVASQKEQQVQQKKLADIKATRERRRLARETRIARAKVSSATKGETSSRAAGVGGSVVTQAASAAGFLGQQTQVGQSIFEQGLLATEAGAKVSAAQSRGQVGSSLVSLAGTGYNIFK